ncbi:MAG: arginine--tRNA ligase, partial [Candidatus Omnitrophica bacterium]|nr:arginine--tRNA ligase [Candidatus Omnitrophota bacterium]
MLEKNISKTITNVLLKVCRKYFQEKVSKDISFPENIEIGFQITRDEKHGDLTSNVAMQFASIIGRSPREIGKDLIDYFHGQIKKTALSDVVGAVELVGGFINVRLSELYYQKTLQCIYSQKEHFGKSVKGQGEHINLEFVSANPTGPLTIAHGRQAAIGDALSRILRFNGYLVTNEYYLNDFGRQINLLGESVRIRYRNLFGKEETMPEDGYMGEYITDIAKEIKSKKGRQFLENTSQIKHFFRKYAVKYMMGLILKDLSDFGVKFDTWTSQEQIEKRKDVEKVIHQLKDQGFVYSKDGAEWFNSTRFGDDKDRVVVKSDGSYTYLAPDMAYHRNKYERGYSRLINLLGPDHHGYIKRMKAAVQALGHDASSLDILIVQLVTLMRGGESVSMSTRKGEFISLHEIIDEIVYKISLDKDFDETLKYCKDYIQTLEYDKLSRNTAIDY